MPPKNVNVIDIKKAKGNAGKKQQVANVFTPQRSSSRTDIFPILQFPPSVGAIPNVPGLFTRKWCFKNNVLVGTSNNPTPVFVLNQGNVVTVRQQGIRVAGDANTWAEIVYTHSEYLKSENRWVTSDSSGWVHDLYLDTYYEPYPNEEVKILHPTDDPTDAKQYMDWDGQTRYNMCGELCVAYIIKKDIDPNTTLESVLENWKNAPNKGSFSYTSDAVKEGTSDAQLRNILQLYAPYSPQAGNAILDFRDGMVKNGILDWGGLHDKIPTHYLIALVMIDQASGTLIAKDRVDGVKHWVLIEKVTRNGSRVLLYNPFPNKLQEYSFSEFVSSCRSNLSGLWVRRKTPLVLEPASAVVTSQFRVTLDAPPDPGAEQYIVREGGRKTNLCGEFCVAYILGKSTDAMLMRWKQKQSTEFKELVTILKAYGYFGAVSNNKPFTIGAVLDQWRDVQPNLYNFHVVENQPTGQEELKSILKAYGYNNPGDFAYFQRELTDPVTGQYLPSPGRIMNKLKTHFLIAGVGIDGTSGKLKRGGGVRHWVVLERLTPNGKHFQDRHFGGNGGWVELYNPFMNEIEGYSYLEFINSANESGFTESAGLWVKRDVTPLFTSQELLFPDVGAKEGKAVGSRRDDSTPRWKLEKLKDDIEKKLNNKKTPEAVLNLLSRLNTGWSSREIANLIPGLKVSSPAPDDDRATVTTFLCKNLDADFIPPEIAEWIRKRSEGNSSLALAIARTLCNNGTLTFENRLGRFNASILPASQSLNKVAARIGPSFVSKAIEEIREIQAQLAQEKETNPAAVRSDTTPAARGNFDSGKL